MWYVVWVRTGKEQRMLELCELQKKERMEAYEECFLPKYERQKKEKGKWVKKEYSLFPGYLFFKTERPEKLIMVLRKIPEFARVLGDDDSPIPIYPQEEAFLMKLMNPQKVVEMSLGFLVGDQLIVTDGPLKDYKGKVVHIDRHKRIATLEVEFFGRTTQMKVGVEVVRKYAGEEEFQAQESAAVAGTSESDGKQENGARPDRARKAEHAETTGKTDNAEKSESDEQPADGGKSEDDTKSV